MCAYTRLDRIRNEVIREKVGVAFIQDKMRETRLRWFDVNRRSVSTLVRRCEMINLSKCKRGRGQPKSWNKVIKYNLKRIGLTKDMVQDRKFV